jgi:phytoene desaturase
MTDFGIIGAGIAGLSAAAHLSANGYSVRVHEANSEPGGKLHAFKQDGYRFDAGPSLFTMPQLLDSVFIQAGKNPRDYYQYTTVDSGCHYFWEDGTRFAAPSHPKAFARAAALTFGVDEAQVGGYLAKAFELYDITEDVFLKSSLHKASTYLKWSTVRSMLQLYKARLFTPMHAVNLSLLEHPKLVQLFDRYATYNGSDPYRAPGTLTVIPTLEYRWGTHLPHGGMHTITRSLYKLCEDLGVEFVFNDPVERIELEHNRAIGLHTAHGFVPYRTVVSNMDVVPTYRKLLKGHDAPATYLKQERSSSALIFYWGVRGSFDALGLHNILWSEDYREEFRTLFEEKDIHDDPTVYINITSKYEPADAPPGCENWFVMVNAPYVAGQDWDALTGRMRDTILHKVSRILGTDIAPLIATEQVLDPPRIERDTSSHLGSLYGTSSNSRMAAFFRHPNFSRHIDNLYFCGGSVHPGGGIPLCLLSGKLVSQLAQ